MQSHTNHDTVHHHSQNMRAQSIRLIIDVSVYRQFGIYVRATPQHIHMPVELISCFKSNYLSTSRKQYRAHY